MYNKRKIFNWILLSLLLFYVEANTQEPTSPNFNSFTPVGNNEIVNQFNGQLNYNIPIVNVPGPNGSGFQMALTYTSNAKPNVQASWVGFGWELSPGAIIRNTKGFPDDYNSTNVIYWDKFRKNITAEKNIMARLELLSKDTEKEPCTGQTQEVDKFSAGIGITSTSRYNNFENHSYNTSLGVNSMYGGFSASWNQKGIPTWIPNVNLRNIENISGIELEEIGVDKTMQRIITPILRLGNIYPSTNIYFFFKDNGRGQFPSSLKEYQGTERSFRPTFNVKANLKKIEVEPGFTFTERIIKPKYTIGKEKKVFGYIYSKNANKKTDMMDYYLEMNSVYDKRDNTLPIPFSNADNFYVSGQGINGSFRFWNSGIGIFRPESVKNEIDIDEIGTSLGAGFVPQGPEVNLGMEYGFGGQSKSVNKSHISSLEDKFKFDNTKADNKNIKSSFASFSNDLGGEINPYYTSNPEYHHKVETFGLSDDLIFDKSPLSFNHSGLSYHMDSKVKQSKNIAFNTFGDLYNDSLGLNLFSYRSKKLKGLKRLDRNLIAEYKIVNEEGKRFNYSLPVFSRNEKTISYGITKLEKGVNPLMSSTENNKIVYHHITPKIDPNNENNAPEVIQGHEMNEPYANSYLLTEILSPDYIDLTNNGPTIDDYGTFTEFHYTRTAGSNKKYSKIRQDWSSSPTSEDYDDSDNGWYNWRTPYNGLNYHKGSHSDQRDNMISMSRGEKEIYYLKAINTKTHLSFFVTNRDTIRFKKLVKGTNNFVADSIMGTSDNRKDGFESVHNEYDVSGDKSATMADVSNDNKLRFLDKIVLFKLDETNPFELSSSGEKIFRVTELIQTTMFEYDYSTWKGEPNSISENGKLTLKKVWVESGDVNNSLYSPYKFDYTYSNESLPTYITNLNENAPGVVLKEDPDYDVLDVDRWGNYRPNNIDEEGRTELERAWVYQNKSDSTYTDGTTYEYDPSAHLLKQITLPSRGKILVNYEENTYSFVQDRPAMIMSRLKEGSYNLSSEMIVDIEKELGIDLETEGELVDSIIKKTQEYYVGTERRIYFKFFYALVGGTATNSLEFCSNEYIEGYARVESCYKNSNNEMVIKFAKHDGDFVPKLICDDFYFNKRYGAFNLAPSTEQPCCDVLNGYSDEFEYEYLTYNELKGKLGYSFLPGETSANYDEFKCLTLNENLSYIRVPLPSNIPKKGGGLRVKRVLYVDGFEKEVYGSGTNNLRVYGNEYFYQDTSGKCSGVATNEPLEGGEENSLVDLTKKRVEKDKSFVAGDFMEEIEGPYGKTILPAAAINYSYVIKKNISNNETHPGFQLNTYLTYKDYPYDGIINNEIELHDYDVLTKSIQTNDRRKRPLIGFEFTKQVDGQTREVKRPLNLGATSSQIDPCSFGSSSIGLSFGGFIEDYVKTTQGTQFIKTNLVGKLKKSISYGGRYNKTESWHKGKAIEYEYFKPGEKQPIVYEDFDIHDGYLGREIEIVLENRRIDEKVNHYKPEIDLGLVWALPPIDEAQGNISYRGSKMRYEHMLTNKIISYPAIVKKVINSLDGVTTITENIGFDQYSGRPILTKSATKHADNLASNYHVKSLNIPATYLHTELSQKSFGTSSPLQITNSYNKMGLFRKKMVNEDNDTIYILSFDVFWDNADRYKIVKHLSKGATIKVSPKGEYDKLRSMSEFYRVINVFNDYVQIVPIYEEGYSNAAGLPPSSMLCKVEIIESGNTNQLTTSIGNINFVADNTDDIPKDKEFIYSDEYEYEPEPSEGIIKDVKNIFAEAINDKIEDILTYVNTDPSYNNNVRIDDTYIRYSDSTISVTLPTDGVEIFDIDGELDTLRSTDFQTGSSRLYISDFMIHKDPLGIPLTYTITDKIAYTSEQIFSQARNDFYVYYTFDLVFERLGEESSINLEGRKYHPYPAALNEIFDNAWSLEVTDILENNNIKYDKTENYNSEVFPITFEVEESVSGFLGINRLFSSSPIEVLNRTLLEFEKIKNITNAWKDIYERIGLRDLYKIKFPILGEGDPDYNGPRNLGSIDSKYIGEYNDFTSPDFNEEWRDLSIITYYDVEEGRYKSYLSRFLLNIKDPEDPNDNSRKTTIGFIRNFEEDSLQSNFYQPLITNHGTNNSSIEIIANGNSFDNSFDLQDTDISSFIQKIESDYKYSREYLEFILDANKLSFNIKETGENIVETSEKEYYSNVRFRDECRRTYMMTMPQKATDQPAHTDPNALNQDYFVIHEGKLMRNHISPRPGFQEIGDFDYDMVNDTIGEYLFGSTEANYFCLHFNPMEEEIYSFDDVLSSSVISIKDNWDLDTNTKIESFNPKDPYRNGSLGRWGLQKQISYRDNIDYASDLATTGRNTKDNKSNINFHTQYANESIGTGDYNNFIMYNWKNNRVNDNLRWINQNQITKRSKNFQVTESKDILNINNSVNYDDSGIRPTIVSQNASSHEIVYNSFDYYNKETRFKPHSGVNTFPVSNLIPQEIEKIVLNPEKEYVIKLWCNLVYPMDTLIYTYQFNPFLFFFSDTLDNIIPGVQMEWEQNITRRVGDWQLFSFKVSSSHLTPESQLTKISIKAVDSVPTNTFVDDFKMTPYYAISKCFAYDYANKRILHEFDNEHYKTDYIYDDEGRLTRKVKETYRGSKTIAEQYSNIPRENVYQLSGQGSLKNNPKYEKPNQKYIRPRNTIQTNDFKPIDLKSSDSKFDILDIKIDETGIHNNILGIDSLSVEDVYQAVESKINKLKDKGVIVDSLKTDSKFDLDKINSKLEDYDIEKIRIEGAELNLENIEIDSLKFNNDVILDSLEKRATIPIKDVKVEKKVRK